MLKVVLWGVGIFVLLTLLAPDPDSTTERSSSASVEATAPSLEPSADTQELQKSPAELLTIIADPSWGERDTTKRRFEFLLPRLVDGCHGIETEMIASDIMVTVYKELTTAGLERDEAP